MSKTKAIVRGLEAMSFNEIKGQSRKYRTFVSTFPGACHYFLGKSAALRIGRTVSDATSVTGTAMYATILERGGWGRE